MRGKLPAGESFYQKRKIPEDKVPKYVEVYDNGGPNKGGTYDRFTVFFPDGACYSMSTNVMDEENGICLFLGNNMRFSKESIRKVTKRDMVPVHVCQKIRELRV